MQDSKVNRLLTVSAILVIISLICIFVSIRYVDKYKNRHAEANIMEQKLSNLEQDLKNLDFRINELEFIRHALSREKEQIGKDYTSIKEKYVSLGKIIKALERDVNTLKNAIEINKEIEIVSGEAEDNGLASRLNELQSQNDKLLQELAKQTKEKMILEIAFGAQAKRLGLSERYDPDLKEIIKEFVISLQ